MRDGWLILVHKGKHRRLYESHGCTELIFQCNHLNLTTYNQNYEHFFCKMVWNCHFCFMFFMLVSFSFHQHRLSHKTAEEQKVETNRDSNGEEIFLVPFGQSCNGGLPCLSDRHLLVVWPFGSFPKSHLLLLHLPWPSIVFPKITLVLAACMCSHTQTQTCTN